ncbi:BspA family leucine-rich repeat surface protein, partial [Xylanibacter ruminicola]
ESEEMFVNCTNLVGGAGTIYNESHVDATYAHLDGGTSNPGYFTDKNAPVITNPEPYAVLSENNTILTFYYDSQKDARNGMSVGPFSSDTGYQSWLRSVDYITKAVFDASFANCTTLTSTAYWFFMCRKLTIIEGIENLKTDNVTDMSGMFTSCYALTSLDVSKFKTDNVTDMSEMFLGCLALTSLDVSNFKTDKVTTMGSMFNACASLTSLDVSNFKTDNVTNMFGMFTSSGLTSLDVSSFITTNVTNMNGMFSYCSSLTSLDVSNFNTDNVTDMSGMFDGCSNLVTIYAGNEWRTDNVSSSVGMFGECTNLVGGKGTVYDPEHTDVSYAHIDGGPSNPGYFTDKNAQEITATFDGVTLTVVGQTTMALALEQVGGRDVVAKDIAAIVWNSTEAITRSDIEGFGNPNLLIYVQADSLAPEGVNNVVVDGKAKNIVLVDADGNNNFYVPQEFTAEKISYTREFKQTTKKNVSRGWEGICLPFDV